jgi:hypothetical protein
MPLMFHRRLVIPLWALAFFTVALTAPPPATLSLIAVLSLIAGLGIAVIAFTIPGLVPGLRASPSVVQVLSDGKRHRRGAATIVVAGTCVRTLDELNPSTPDDALDLVRMDDDGGWQMPRPPA